MAESSSFPDGSGGITEEWLKALRNANCLKLKDLLHYRSGLIAVYLEEKEWDKNYKCTALHVAVKAGCTELVDTILDIFEDVFKDICEEFETLSYGTEVSTVQPHPELDEGGILTKRKVPEARALLKELLSAIDGYSRLNALAIAVVNKNPRVIHILLRVYSRFGYPTFTYLSSEVPDASSEGSSEGDHNVTTQVDDEYFGEKLRNTIRGVVVEMGSLGDVLRENFKGDSKLNFLPWEEYMYHHVVGNDPIRNVGVTTKFIDLLGKKTSEDPGLARYLLKLRDGSGRTPISSAVSWHENNVFSMIPDGPGNDDCLNITDFAGRTLLHRAAANGPETCLRLLVEDYRTNLNAVVSAPKKFTAPKTNTDVDLYDIDIDALSADHNYSTLVEDSEYKSTPLYLAIVHSKEAHVKHLLHADFDYRRHPKYRLDLNQRCVCDVQYFADFTSLGSRNLQPSVSSNKRLWIPLQLAALMGQEQTLTLLANDDRAYDPGRLRNLSKKPGWTGYQAYTACQLAAASGNPVALRELLDSKKFDPLFKDEEGNSVLHFAIRENRVIFNKHLMDIVSCNDRGENLGRSTAVEGGMIKGDTADRNTQTYREQQIQYTVKMLLRAGLDIWNFKENKLRQIADPGSAASPAMRAWWNSLLDDAILEEKNGMQTAANAVAVTAALVATASYVGPLQPPLGYSESNNLGHIHTEIVSVRIFVVCDTLAFYLAVAGIMFAMIPSLSLPQESVMDELRRIKWTLTVSIVVLILAIVCVLGAFAAASIAVTSNDGAWNKGGLPLSTAVIGMLICLSAVYVWCLLMMRLLFYKNGYARKHYLRLSGFF